MSEVSLANMFSHKISSLFILMMFSLAVQKLLFLMNFHLFIFPLFSLPWEIYWQKYCYVRYLIFYYLFSPRNFMISRLIFKSFTYFEFILVYGVSWWSSFIFFACTCPDLPTAFIEEVIFTPFYVPAPFVKY